MAAGARGRGWRGFRSRRGRGGAAFTHRSPWPPRQTRASPPRGSALTCKPHHSTPLRKIQSPQPVAPGIKPEFLGLDRKALDQALVSLCPARPLRRGFGDGRIRRSCDVGVGGFILVTLGCWFHCRYNYAKLRIQERIARDGIKNQILYESTHLDPERKQSKSGS
uniref:Cytochrome c oxidase assembly protein COX20, mitochondrial n=1 Tax=Mustela putorius furo TaxID=9669 RepID=M3YWD1_MUSPF